MATQMNRTITTTLTISFLLHGAALLLVLGVNHFFEPEEQLLQLNEIEFMEAAPPKPPAEAAQSENVFGRILRKSIARGRRLFPAMSSPLISKSALAGGAAPETILPKDTVRLAPQGALNVKQVIPPGWIQKESGKISMTLKSTRGINLTQTGRLSLGDEHSSLLGDGRLLSKSGPSIGTGLITRSGATAESLLKEIQKSKGLGGADGPAGDEAGEPGGSQADVKHSRPKSGFKDMYAIRGEIRYRKLLRVEMPLYPPWAEEQGIEGEVTLRVRVEPDGSVVASSIYVLKTSGYAELDRLAKEALSRWFFAALGTNEKQRDQIGEVRFAFRLKRG